MSAPTMKELEVDTLIWVKRPGNPDEHQVSAMTAADVTLEHGCPRNVLKNYLRKEIEEAQACWGLPFTLLLVVSYAIVALSHDNASVLRAVEDSMDHDIIENANFAFTGAYMGHKGMDDVNSVADFWSWMANGLVPLVFIQAKPFHEGYDDGDPWYINGSNLEPNTQGLWLSYNRIVGGARLRQERSDDEPCSPPKDLLAVYDMQCVGGHGYELDPEIRSARFTADPQREVWLYVHEDLATLQGLIWEWERTMWLDRKTKKVELAIPAYNGELGLHVMIYVNFFFSRGGHIWKKMLPLSFTSTLHPHWYYWIGDFVWLFCVFYIFATELLEIADVVKRKGFRALQTDYISFWNAFDWFSLACAFVVIGMFIAVMTMVNGLNDSLQRQENPLSSGTNTTAFTIDLHTHVNLLEETVEYVNNFRMVMAAYPLIIILRLFKAYASQPRLAMVTKTLETAGQELLEFGLVFFSVFITITISGVVLFGREVTSFGTLPRAVFASFRMLIGDLMWDELSKIGRLFAFTWIALFMIICVMLLLNMLLAIIMKHYVQAKDSAGNAQTLWDEGFEVFRRWRDERYGRTVSIEQVLACIEKAETKDAQQEISFMEEEEFHIATDEETALEELGKVLMVDELMRVYSENIGKEEELSEEQAQLLMTLAIEDFYEHNHSSIDMDEVLKLTHKVEYRTQKLNRMSKLLDKKTLCPNEVKAMEHFLGDLETFTDELRSECESQRREVADLRTLKRGLLLQLQTRQSLIAGLDKTEDDPTSVNALLSRGKYSEYDWRLGSRYSDEPLDESRGRGGGRHREEEQEESELREANAPVDQEKSSKDVSALDGGVGMQSVSAQPRYAIEDPVSDDELLDGNDIVMAFESPDKKADDNDISVTI